MKLYKILIVCQDTETLSNIKKCFDGLESYYLFYDAANVKAGFRLAFEFCPDLIIIDHEISELDSLDLLKSLKEHDQTCYIPTIVLINQSLDSEQIHSLMDVGTIDCIRKPIDKVEVISKTRIVLMLLNTFKHTLTLKDRELTNTAIQIARNREFSANIYDKIKKLFEKYGDTDSQLKNILAELKDEISEKLKVETWNQFDMYIKKIHPDFFSQLILECPTISPSELRLAAFLKLNIETKDIASILFLTVDSVRTARTRLRKKLKIKREENLTTYLSKI